MSTFRCLSNPDRDEMLPSSTHRKSVAWSSFKFCPASSANPTASTPASISSVDTAAAALPTPTSDVAMPPTVGLSVFFRSYTMKNFLELRHVAPNFSTQLKQFPGHSLIVNSNDRSATLESEILRSDDTCRTINFGGMQKSRVETRY